MATTGGLTGLPDDVWPELSDTLCQIDAARCELACRRLADVIRSSRTTLVIGPSGLHPACAHPAGSIVPELVARYTACTTLDARTLDRHSSPV